MVEILERPEVRESPVQLDEIGKVLLKARDYIREHGWCQNAFMHFEDECAFPSVCMVGALNWATGHAIDDDVSDIWAYYERLGFPRRSGAIDNWNDTTDRTQQEVEERLERAAYKL